MRKQRVKAKHEQKKLEAEKEIARLKLAQEKKKIKKEQCEDEYEQYKIGPYLSSSEP